MTDLFRREAISHATRRLSGTVVLATPLSVRLLGMFFGVIVFAAVLFASQATYARKETVTGSAGSRPGPDPGDCGRPGIRPGGQRQGRYGS